MYKVNEIEFSSWTKAVEYADSTKATVYGVREGRIVWSPAPTVSAKKMRMYRERMAAYKAQEAAKAGKKVA